MEITHNVSFVSGPRVEYLFLLHKTRKEKS